MGDDTYDEAIQELFTKTSNPNCDDSIKNALSGIQHIFNKCLDEHIIINGKELYGISIIERSNLGTFMQDIRNKFK